MSVVSKILRSNLFIVECNLPIKLRKPIISVQHTVYLY